MAFVVDFLHSISPLPERIWCILGVISCHFSLKLNPWVLSFYCLNNLGLIYSRVSLIARHRLENNLESLGISLCGV